MYLFKNKLVFILNLKNRKNHIYLNLNIEI